MYMPEDITTLYTAADLARLSGYNITRVHALIEKGVVTPQFSTPSGVKFFSRVELDRLVSRRSEYLDSLKAVLEKAEAGNESNF